MTSIFPPFNRRTSFRKQPYFFEAGRGVNSKGLAGPIPALSLTFTSGALDPRITFSRPSLATYFDSTGKLTYAPNNLILRSQEFENPAWSTFSGTLPVATDIIAPDGTATADRFNYSAIPATRYRYQSVNLPLPGTYIFSLWAKAQSPAVVGLRLSSYTGATNTQAAISVGTTWQRISIVTIIAAGDLTGEVGIDQRAVIVPGVTENAIIDVWGAQLEAVTYQTTPSTYVATTASAYYGPRFEYDPVTLVPRGLLIEEARTNLTAYSQDMFNGAWTPINCTRASSSVFGPDGVSTLALITPTSTGNRLQYGGSATSGVTYTLSGFFQAGTANFAGLVAAISASAGAIFNLTGNGSVVSTIGTGVTATIQKVSATLFKCTMTFAATATGSLNYGWGVSDGSTYASGIYPSAASGTIYGSFFQLEAGSFATSYLPTGASTAARSADDVSMTGTNFSSWYNQPQGTFIVGFKPDVGLVSGARILATTSGGVSNRVIDLNYLGTNWVNYNGTTSVAIGPASFTTALQRIAAAYQTANYGYALSGATPVADGNVPVNSPTELRIGNISSGNFLNGHIASIQYYTSRLSNDQLQALTQPSLEASMFLTFDTTSSSFIDANWGP